MKIHFLRPVTIALFRVSFVTAQPVDDTQLKQVIIFGRHSVRSPVAPNSYLNSYAVRPFPVFSVAPGILTDNGATLETILGSYYRLWLTKEGLLTGNDLADAAFVYFRANVLQRTVATAQAFAAVMGRLGGNPQSLASAYAAELALTRSVLFNYPASQTPVPGTPAGTGDVTTIPIDVTAGPPGMPVNLGGLITVANTIDPFVMEYAEGLPASDVGWGQLTVGGVSQTSRFITLAFDLEFRTPYLAGVQSSNLASHVVRSMVQAATGNAMTGALGNPSSKVIMLVASDVNVTGLAGLFHLDWMLPGYQANYCAPGGALVF